MIVLDEQLADPKLIHNIKLWYKGKVISIVEARPDTRITDDVIASLLHKLREPTFVTINHEDFWRRVPADLAYCVICLKLTGKRSSEVPQALRETLSRREWRTKRGPLGTVILVGDQRIASYSVKQKHIELITR